MLKLANYRVRKDTGDASYYTAAEKEQKDSILQDIGSRLFKIFRT